MNKNFRKWLACAIAVTIAVYNAPYSVEALEVIKDSVQVDSNNSPEEEGTKLEDEQNSDLPQAEEDAAQPEDDGVQSEDGTQAEEGNSENTTEQNNTGSLKKVGAFLVSGEERKDWTFSDNGELKILKDAINNNIRIEGDGQETTNRVLIEAGYQGTVTIKNLNIDSKDKWSRAFEVQSLDGSTTNVELILEGENTLKSGGENPGLKFEGKGSGSSLTIKGDGQLTAIGRTNGAGIGGGYEGSGSNITISGGTVTAIGGTNGAGIGGGNVGSGSNITISGGSVKASSISDIPKDEKGRKVYLVKLDKQEEFKEGDTVKLSGQTASGESISDKDYKVASNHEGDSNFYLYMPAGKYTITIHKYSCEVAVKGEVETPNPEDMLVTNTKEGFLVDVSTYSSEYGKVMCSLDRSAWVKEDDKRQILLSTNTKKNTEEKTQEIYIKYGGNNFYDESKSSSKTFKIGNITIKDEIEYTGSGITEKDIINSNNSGGNVTFEYYKKNEEGKFIVLDNPPKDLGSYKVKATLKPNGKYTGAITEKEFTISKATSSIEFKKDTNFGKQYDGKAVVVTIENVETSGSKGEVSFKFEKKVNDKWVELGESEAPINVGEYKVVASVEEDTNYKEASIEKEFKITQAKNIFTEELSIEGWKYKEEAKVPTAKAKFGEVVFTYSSEENGTYTSNVPTNAGTYYVKAEVLGTDNYTGITAIKRFTIERIEIPEESGKFEVTVPEWVEGNETQEPTVTIPEEKPEGEIFNTKYYYKILGAGDDTYTEEVPKKAGRYTLKIEIKSENYKKVITKDFTIYAKVPEINEENKNENVNTSTDKIEINTEITEGDTGVYLYCTESTEVPAPPTNISTSREVNKWEKVTGSKHVFTGLKPNTTYHVWKYDNAKPEGQKLTYEYYIKTDTPSTPSIPSKPEEKPGIGVEVEVVDKIAGEDRYDTSVSISQKVFPSKSDKVYLVSGEKFPDALSSAALTGKGDGPILLINDKNIDKILAEIDRLGAKEIVFVGGNSISDANEDKINKFAKENSSVVEAFVGEDRYETAVKVAEETISKYGNKGKVIIADGRNYPDAVSIASYAAKEGIPVILVNGNKVPDVVKNLLNKYKINSAIIVGGDKAVGKDVEKLFKTVDRVAGVDRYDTSKKIAEKFFASSNIVFVASGESFADSLSVSYYAGAKNAPILLTKANSLDNDTREYLEKNKNKDYIIVGGDKAVNPDLFK